MADASKPWFAPKRYGYGASLPVSWQGWAALLLFLIGMIAATTMLHDAWRAVVLTGLIVALVLVAANKTAGGWRWRWRRGDDR